MSVNRILPKFINNILFTSNKRIKWIPKNIGPKETNNTTNMHNLLEKYSNILLKMDIEGYEFEWIRSLNQTHLNNISQLVIEFHNCNNGKWNWDCLEKINNTFYLIHINGSSYGDNFKINNIIVPCTLECTYLNKKHFKKPPKLNTYSFPTNIDFTYRWTLKKYFIDMKPVKLDKYPYNTNKYDSEEISNESINDFNICSQNYLYFFITIFLYYFYILVNNYII